MTIDPRREPAWLRGVSWLEAQRQQFALDPGRLDPDDLFPLKVVAELARVADVLSRSPVLPAGVAERLAALLRDAWEQLGEGRVFAMLLATGPYVVLGTMYSIFERHGFVHRETRERLAQLAAPGGVSARQFRPRDRSRPSTPTPFGADAPAVLALALALAWDDMGLPSPWRRQRLLPLTRLSRRPDVPTLSPPEAYSLTHVVFFATDFGARPAALDAACREYLRRRCPAWMEDLRRRSDLDLYSELAAALACIGEALPPDVETVLSSAQSGDGMLPGPRARSRRGEASTDDAARRRFLESYHTTLAGVLASFAATVGLTRAADDGVADGDRPDRREMLE